MAKKIEMTEKQVNKYEALRKMIGLGDLLIVDDEYDEINERRLLICVPRWAVAICPECDALSSKVHDYPNQRMVHDRPIGGSPVVLVYDSRRFECEECGHKFIETISDVVGSCSYTYGLMAELADARKKQAIATLAETYHLGYKLVESIILKAGRAKLEKRKEKPLPIVHLGIDEISLHKGQGNYVLVLTDLQRRIVLDILADRHKQSLIAFLKQPPQGLDLSSLDTVAIDLWSQYREAVQEVYPTVDIVADRFHVVQNLHEAIHQIRRDLQAQAHNDTEKKNLKGLRYLLLKNKENLSETDQERLQVLAQTQPQLYHLWQLRQDLHDWYEEQTTPETALLTLDLWLQQAQALALPPLDKFCQTLTNWKDQIVSFFNHRITSGFVEGMNSKIKLLKRIAFGIPNFQHFRLRILWACG
jgi:transposase